jgi:hypothetical protein
MTSPASDDPVHLKLDILTHSMMEGRAESKLARGTIVRTQWTTCGIGILVALVAVIVVYRQLP